MKVNDWIFRVGNVAELLTRLPLPTLYFSRLTEAIQDKQKSDNFLPIRNIHRNIF